jgi:hypothetical protein
MRQARWSDLEALAPTNPSRLSSPQEVRLEATETRSDLLDHTHGLERELAGLATQLRQLGLAPGPPVSPPGGRQRKVSKRRDTGRHVMTPNDNATQRSNTKRPCLARASTSTQRSGRRGRGFKSRHPDQGSCRSAPDSLICPDRSPTSMSDSGSEMGADLEESASWPEMHVVAPRYASRPALLLQDLPEPARSTSVP